MRTRVAFVHVPKSAGSSIKNAVTQRCAAASIAPIQLDRVLFGSFDRFDEMPARTRSTIAVDGPGEIDGFDVVMWHFGFASLAPHFAPADTMTVLREPRSRLLSHYTFWRGWSSARHADWDPYDASRRAVSATFGEFLQDPTVASQTDNLVTRMLLAPHPSIPADGFIDDGALEELAALGGALLDDFGFADVVESGPALWRDLSSWLDADVEPERTLVTEVQPGTDWVSDLTPTTTAALARRTAIDARLWSRLAARRRDDASALAESTFLTKLASVVRADAAVADSTPATPPTRTVRLIERLRR